MTWIALLLAALTWPLRRADLPVASGSVGLGARIGQPSPVDGDGGRGADGTVKGRSDHEEVAFCALLLALALRSGCSIPAALIRVADVVPAAPAADLRAVAAALHWGKENREAWAYADPRWELVAAAMGVATRAGASPSPTLLAVAEQIRQEAAAARTAAAARAGVWLVLPLGFLFLPAFLVLAVVPLVANALGAVLSG